MCNFLHAYEWHNALHIHLFILRKHSPLWSMHSTKLLCGIKCIITKFCWFTKLKCLISFNENWWASEHSAYNKHILKCLWFAYGIIIPNHLMLFRLQSNKHQFLTTNFFFYKHLNVVLENVWNQPAITYYLI